MRQVCKQYEIRDNKKLRNWILRYNGYKQFNERGAGTEIYMIKGRKTTQGDRREIVAFCIEHEKTIR